MIVLKEPKGDLNGGDLFFLEEYKNFILKGLKKRVSKEKNLSKTQAIQKKQKQKKVLLNF